MTKQKTESKTQKCQCAMYQGASCAKCIKPTCEPISVMNYANGDATVYAGNVPLFSGKRSMIAASRAMLATLKMIQASECSMSNLSRTERGAIENAIAQAEGR